jgi:hypothetical protein
MKTFHATLVADTTVYASIEVKADSLDEALDFALRRDKRPLPAWEMSGNEPYDQRVTEIADNDGVTVYEDDEYKPCCETCQGKGWEVFNDDTLEFPLGEIACCDDCQAKDGKVDDEPAAAKAVAAGYGVHNHDGHSIVIRRPGDAENLVAPCSHCKDFLLIEKCKNRKPVLGRKRIP